MQEVKQPNKKPFIFYYLIALVAIMLINSLLVPQIVQRAVKEVDYNTFMQMTYDKQIDEVQVQDNQIVFTAKDDKTIYKTGLMDDPDRTQRLYDSGAKFSSEIVEEASPVLSFLISWLLPLIIIIGFGQLMYRQMAKKAGGDSMMFGMGGMGKSNAKVYVKSSNGIKFTDVAGEDEAKENLTEIVEYLHDPDKYKEIGASMPKGILLVGPPGTGKTMLAKAVAGEANVPFFSMSGSEFVEMFVGMGASKVRDLFRQAKEKAPCIVFIDEIDAIGRSRDSKYGGGNEEREQTLNQLLSEMDGFDSSKGILILGATNRPEILDKALLRPGRFDRRIIVDKPDLKGRVEILKVHAKDVKMDETVDLDAIALATSGAVGSDLANMINEAAINAVKEGREFVSQKDLFAAVEQVLVGKEKKDRIMSKEERRIVSYHEVGHALISALQKNSEPVQKITIVPRTMGALGYVMQVPEEEKYLNTEAELRDMLVGLVGGRAAEEVVFDTVTTGAANDIEKATSIARNMITRYGMSKRFGLVGLATVESQYLEGRTALNCSDETAAAIDEEVVAMIKESYDQALQMLRENRELMDKLAAFLIERETITGKEFMEIFRREKGLPDPEEEKKDAAEGATGQKAETKKDETDNTVADAMKGNNIDVTIGEQVMTSTDPTFQPLAFEDSLQEAKEQTTSENATKETAGEASQSDAAVEKPENKTETSAESKDSKDPKDPPQGPVGLFSHGTIS